MHFRIFEGTHQSVHSWQKIMGVIPSSAFLQVQNNFSVASGDDWALLAEFFTLVPFPLLFSFPACNSTSCDSVTGFEDLLVGFEVVAEFGDEVDVSLELLVERVVRVLIVDEYLQILLSSSLLKK